MGWGSVIRTRVSYPPFLKPNRGGTWGDNANMTAQAYRQLHNTANASHADTNNRGLRLVCRDD